MIMELFIDHPFLIILGVAFVLLFTLSIMVAFVIAGDSDHHTSSPIDIEGRIYLPIDSELEEDGNESMGSSGPPMDIEAMLAVHRERAMERFSERVRVVISDFGVDRRDVLGGVEEGDKPQLEPLVISPLKTSSPILPPPYVE
ncbi:hypothetical protein P691DRAFT_774375 [Macrolepiota fuliginosa MF-IS2]|uniref:Uncharacterized protein n=1 Tax=Macrolepiota fuliginosa MF-IS2 TaxID=1400762 RepID=A0A9P6C5I5_9AGAR|nr:hypothetical protein P691DRAFT_774375 [Macrolepiota fuliginosa MF-IS2]